MSRDIVVLAEVGLSSHDASEVSALRLDGDGQVTYHLVVSAQHTSGGDGDWPALGITARDTFGSEAVAHVAGADAPADIDSSVGELIERSARNLRAHGGAVHLSVTRGDLLSGGQSLVDATGSREAIVIARPETYLRCTLREWQRRASTQLGVDHLSVIRHAD